MCTSGFQIARLCPRVLHNQIQLLPGKLPQCALEKLADTGASYQRVRFSLFINIFYFSDIVSVSKKLELKIW